MGAAGRDQVMTPALNIPSWTLVLAPETSQPPREKMIYSNASCGKIINL